MSPATLLVLAFLDLFPLPVCTLAFPFGDVMSEPSCPGKDLGNDSGLMHNGIQNIRCVRRFRI